MPNAIARVFVNDVEVGSMPANQYERVVAIVRSNRRLYLAQAFNYLGVLWRFAVMIVRVSVMLWLLSIIALVLISPDSTAYLLAALSQSAPADVAQTLRILLLSSMILAILSMLFCWMFGLDYRYGYINKFDLAVNRHIRSLMEVPAAGDVRVTIVKEDNHHE